MLMDGPVCGTEFLDEHIPRYAARISELRATGVPIETRPCRGSHHHHITRQVQYVLVSERLF